MKKEMAIDEARVYLDQPTAQAYDLIPAIWLEIWAVEFKLWKIKEGIEKEIDVDVWKEEAKHLKRIYKWLTGK